MKHFFKYKKIKPLLKFIAVSALFGTIIAASCELVNITNNNSTPQQIGFSKQDAVVNPSQPTINDIVNDDVSSSNQTISTGSGSYILPTLNSQNLPGIIKLSSFVTELYGINFNSFSGYHVRQVIQNYNNKNQYFILLVNNSASVTATIIKTPTENINFNITNPGHVLSVIDSGTNFNITSDYQLDKPILDQSMIDYYSGIYFQSPLTPDQTIAQPKTYKLSLEQGTTLPEVTPDTLGVKFWARAKWYQTPTGFPDKNTPLRNIDGTWTDYTQSIATLLYLNSLNNMTFVSNKSDNQSEGSDAIYIFGGNKYINLWFYTFYVNNETASAAPIVEYASGYANYRFWWSDFNGGADWSTSYSSDLVTQKAYNWDLENYNQTFIDQTKSLNNYPNASFLGYYVAGAKYIQEPKPQIQLSLIIPNYALSQYNKLIIGTSNVFFNTGNKYVQSPGVTTLNIYASISVETAIETTGYRNSQVSSYLSNSQSWSTSNDWVPRYSNPKFNLIKVLSTTNGKASYDVTDTANDGYKAKYYNKLLEYLPEDIGNKNVSFVYERGSMSAIICETDLTSTTDKIIQKTVSIPLVLQNSETKMDDFTNIFFAGDTWFLIYKPKGSNQTTIYTFKYKSETDEVAFQKANFQIANNLSIISIMPLNDKFINILAKDTTTNKLKQFVFQAIGDEGNYSQYLPYSNLLDSNKITNEGVLTYATNGVQDSDQKAIWGSVTFKSTVPSEVWNLINSPGELENNKSIYKSLIQYIPGWEGQSIKVSGKKAEDGSFTLTVSIEYFNGIYYSPEQLLGNDQSSKSNLLSKTYEPKLIKIPKNNNPVNSNASSWTEVISIAFPLILMSFVALFGLLFGIPYAKTKYLHNKKSINKKQQFIYFSNKAIKKVKVTNPNFIKYSKPNFKSKAITSIKPNKS